MLFFLYDYFLLSLKFFFAVSCLHKVDIIAVLAIIYAYEHTNIVFNILLAISKL